MDHCSDSKNISASFGRGVFIMPSPVRRATLKILKRHSRHKIQAECELRLLTKSNPELLVLERIDNLEA
jgi:hypothetical protein